MKNSHRIVTFIALICLASVASADFSSAITPSSSVTSMFQIAPNDLSVFVLMHIFGGVGQVLPGDYLLMGQIFQYFNIAVLSATLLIPVTWVVVRSVLETAHEGKFLGSKMHSVWVPIRISAAMALLAPVGSAYSSAQIVIMWCVLQGVGAADSLWQIGLQYFQEHGGFVYTSQSADVSYEKSGGTDASGANDLQQPNALAFQLLAGEYCMAKGYYTKNNSPAYAPAPTLLPTISRPSDLSFTVSGKKVQWLQYNFSQPRAPYKAADIDNQSCGSVFILDADTENSSALTDAYGENRALAMNNSMESILSNLAETAKYLVYSPEIYGLPNDPDKALLDAMTSMNSASTNPIAIGGSLFNSSVYAASESAAESDTWDSASAGDPYKTDYIYGWAYAGARYYAFLKSVGKDMPSSSKSAFAPQVKALPSAPLTDNNVVATLSQSSAGEDAYVAVCAYTSKSNSYSEKKYAGDGVHVGQYTSGAAGANDACVNLNPLYKNANTVTNVKSSGSVNKDDAVAPSASAIESFYTATQSKWYSHYKSVAPPLYDPVSIIVFESLGVGLYNDFKVLISYSGVYGGPTAGDGSNFLSSLASTSVISNSKKQKSPMELAVTVGVNILDALTATLSVLTYALMALSAVAGICAAEQPAIYVFFALLCSTLPVIFAMFGILYTIGFMLADYLPMVPFIIFFFATAGWVFAVVECMVAAPIAALGMTFPEGHDLFGGAKAIMEFVTTISLTPLLILIGFFSSMYLQFALVGLLNMTFAAAFLAALGGRMGATQGHGHGAVSFTNFDEIIFLTIYAFMVVLVVHKTCTFGMVQLPIGVLRVLGFSGGGMREYMGGEQAVMGVAKQGGETLGKSAGDMGSAQVGKSMFDAGDATGRAGKKEKDDETDLTR
ncbi:MAG: DotA/TraY family protein [Gammaproteobacteria bacterium]|nr:DotA/TraY family protein [Gammaproteobacteria bacterium]